MSIEPGIPSSLAPFEGAEGQPSSNNREPFRSFERSWGEMRCVL